MKKTYASKFRFFNIKGVKATLYFIKRGILFNHSSEWAQQRAQRWWPIFFEEKTVNKRRILDERPPTPLARDSLEAINSDDGKLTMLSETKVGHADLLQKIEHIC